MWKKVIALRSNGPSVPLCLLEKANCNLMSIILTLMKLHSMKYWLVGAMRVIELGKCSLLIHNAFHTFLMPYTPLTMPVRKNSNSV